MLEEKTALVILGGAKLIDIKLEKFAPDEGRCGFLFATSDSASSNVLAIRYLTCEAQVTRKLLIIHFPCWSHIVSLSVAHSQPNLDVSNLRSMARLIDRGKFSPIEAHVTKLVCEAKSADTQLEAETRYAIWMELIRFLVGCRGSFTPQRMSGKLEEIVRRACRCFPNGPPSPNTQWEIGKDASAEVITTLMTALFRMNCTVPCLTRRYTVGTFAWYSVGLAMRQLVFPLVGDFRLNYWPNSPDDEEKAGNESKKRSVELADFLHSDKFPPTIIT